MTGAEYANLVAGYVAKRFASRGLTVYREVRIGKTIIGKDRCIDVFCVSKDAQKAFAIEQHMLAASPQAAYCLPMAEQSDTTSDTRELDHLLAVHFGWWDVLVERKSPIGSLI